ncbi:MULTISPECIES: hypothetical protein [unclassified Bradyrhizobium]|uniref:hypothetical protein n=1 Tax=unclassified Bradyrhizobium TaxID=2631580 RepID=UPI001CD6634B|nr:MULTISPECIES: hypothetical protein [unclassified Bradyrhizobium]MCA1386454.1 hypothetical protein [Bradyrhizobium sp. BRP05]MCA1394560.1 hypothetical protein [Bradyrhizobium sp. IC3123]MCA1424188.1 hypothetical protein [Bradyrhizobium sp. BRP23]MCA1431248.1 hypothetical protein [Bradyrhizobium sp. NBAIM16]MCA1480666.1 hypothetical protein [Bradyrhizobium sp. NBAIM08]
MFERLWHFDWPLMRQLLVIGIPISVGSMIGNGLFVAAALLAGLISTSALAAHQIAVQVDVILLVFLSVSAWLRPYASATRSAVTTDPASSVPVWQRFYSAW